MPDIIEVCDLVERLGSGTAPTLIDARDMEEYAKGHLTGAINIPQLQLTILQDSDALALFECDVGGLLEMFGVSTTDSIVVYDETSVDSYGAACRAWFLMRWVGLADVSLLHGGLAAWTRAGHAVSTEETTPRVGSIERAAQGELVATAAEVGGAAAAGVFLLDDREVAEWRGLTMVPPHIVELAPNFCPRKGRIPGAKWLSWKHLMLPEDDWKFRSPDEIREICKGIGLTELAQPVIIYCCIGTRASNTLMALRSAGFTNVKNYIGSWYEWSKKEDLPIDSAVLPE